MTAWRVCSTVLTASCFQLLKGSFQGCSLTAFKHTHMHTKNVRTAHSVKWHFFLGKSVWVCLTSPSPPSKEGIFFFKKSLLCHRFQIAVWHTECFFLLPEMVWNCSLTTSHSVSTWVYRCQWKPRCCWILVSDSSSSLPSESRENQYPQNGFNRGSVENCIDKTKNRGPDHV